MPNLIDHLAFRAKFEPTSVAVQGAQRQITHGRLLLLVKSIANKLRQAGIRPGEVVITSIPDPYIDWIITLALFHEACVTCSNHLHSPIAPSVEYDWMITDRAIEHFPRSKTLLIDNDWLKDAQALPHDIEQHDYESEASPVRICLTSGTTGTSKAVAHTIGQVKGKCQAQLLHFPYPRVLSLMRLSTGIGFNAALGSLMTGFPVYCALLPREQLELISRFSIEALFGSPIQLAGLMRGLAETDDMSSLRAVVSAGGQLSPVLLQNIRTRLADNVANLYGSTEVGPVCVQKKDDRTVPSMAGYPLPNVEVQIVGESGEVLPRGSEGSVRIRTPYMAQGYRGAPELSATSFRQGWFHPGDNGRLLKDGLLVLSGRDSELINRGGVKIDPASIDRLLADYPGVEDGAAFGLENSMGILDVAVALVVPEDFDIGALRKGLLERLGAARAPSMFFRVAQVPRNQMGKALRAELTQRSARLLAEQQAAKDAPKA